MYGFLTGFCIFACQVVFNKAQEIPVCRPDQVDMPTVPCARYAREFGFCTTNVPSIRPFMIRNCPITCEFCRVPPPTTPVPTTPVCRPDQVDQSSSQCMLYQTFDFCTIDDEVLRQFMVTNCPVTCGVCRVLPPTTATEGVATTHGETTVQPTTLQQTTAGPTTQQSTTAGPTTPQQTTAKPTTHQQTTHRQTTLELTAHPQTTPGPTTAGLTGYLNVTLLVFSGREDPQWQVLESNPYFEDIQRLLGHAQASGFVYRLEAIPARLGYKGFLVQHGMMEHLIVGPNTTTLQERLLETMPSFRQSVLEEIRNGTVLPAFGGMMKRAAPMFNPARWNNNAFVRINNNCYNYANDIITNSFAQPGRGGGALFALLNGPAVQAAAMADGLQLHVPGASPPIGSHLVALCIWQGIDFHWLRLDANMTWSHKPGKAKATDKDNAGNAIFNPSQANLGNYVFFTFMTTNKTNVNIL